MIVSQVDKKADVISTYFAHCNIFYHFPNNDVMYIGLYICMHVCMYICACIRMDVRTYTTVDTCIHNI